MYKSEMSCFFPEDNDQPFSFGLQTLKSLKVGVFQQDADRGAGTILICSFPSFILYSVS